MPEVKGSKYYTVVTDIGQAKIANSIYSGRKLDFTTLKLGDGNGEEYNPSTSQTDLKRTVWQGNVVNVEIDEENSNWVNIYTVIAPSDGGFWIREMGVFDSDGDMIGICNVAPSYKPTLDEGSGKEITIKMTMAVVNTSAITLKIDPTVIYAKRKDVLDLQTKVNIITAQLNAMMYETAGGTATQITLTMPTTLKNGYWKKFIASKDNGGAATTINGKPVYKPCTTSPPNFKAGKAYEVWFNLAGNNFFWKASAEGNAVAANVLANKTFSNDDDSGIVGTMPNNGALGATLKLTGGTYNIPAGYTSGGTVKADITNCTAGNIKYNVAVGGVTGSFTGDGTITADKVVKGYVGYSKGTKYTGTATPASIGGYNKKTGTIGKNQTVDVGFNIKRGVFYGEVNGKIEYYIYDLEFNIMADTWYNTCEKNTTSPMSIAGVTINGSKITIGNEMISGTPTYSGGFWNYTVIGE